MTAAQPMGENPCLDQSMIQACACIDAVKSAATALADEVTRLRTENHELRTRIKELEEEWGC